MPRRLTKHHGLANDFLLWINGDVDEGARLAQLWCNRRTGIGADGLLIATEVTPTSATMTLFNADGSRAEISGNGIRCFAQGVFDGAAGEYIIATDAGDRTVAMWATPDRNTVQASVCMGEVSLAAEPSGWRGLGCDPMRPVRHLSVGNPHSVVGVDDVHAVDLESLGALVPHVNLEVIEPGPEPHAITMRVHERGAGVTAACGSGACASATAALAWGFVPTGTTEVVVHMDGGDAIVRFDSPAVGVVTLVGPSTLIASLDMPE